MKKGQSVKDPENTGRDQAGRFRAGCSGNPNGRPKGTRNHATRIAEQLMANDVEAVVRAVIAAAKEGNVTAARVILDRLVPLRSGRPACLDIRIGSDAASVLAAFRTVAEATCTGQITPDEGQSLVAVLEAQRRALETFELLERVRRLEKAISEEGKQE